METFQIFVWLVLFPVVVLISLGEKPYINSSKISVIPSVNPGLRLYQILMAAGDTFRAAASEQLEVWAERTDSEIVVGEGEKAKASSGIALKVTFGLLIVLIDL